MASKESSRFRSLSESLKHFRSKPPTVVEQAVNFSQYCQNVSKDESAKQLIDQLVTVDTAKYQLTAILEHVVHLKKVVLRVGAVRVNKWGKIELLLSEVVGALKSLKATPLEIEALSWVSYNTSDDAQKKFLDEKVASGENASFMLRLLELRFGKNNGAFPGGKDPVFGVWQIVKIAPEPVGAPPSSPDASKDSSEPPAKKRKTNPKPKKDSPPPPSSESFAHAHEMTIAELSDPINLEV